MNAYIGLRKDKAIRLAALQGIEITFVSYSSFKGIDDGDSNIVIRQKKLDNDILELIISEFKTKL